MLNLNNVTLICVDGTDSIEENLKSFKSILYSSKDIKFAKIKFIASMMPRGHDNIEFIKIGRLSYSDYNDFIIMNLSDYIDTDYVLTIQNDGFVLNPTLWDDVFLEYDYIGAPWRNIDHYKGIRVGNGGFSLRSKNFLEICKNKCQGIGFNEDHMVCIEYRHIFLQNNIKYAPVEIAMKFSLEFPIDECEFDLSKTFGFHGDKTLSSKLLNSIKII